MSQRSTLLAVVVLLAMQRLVFAYQLNAIDRPVASTGDTIVLEGVFGSTVTVNFPGSATATATVLGANRATAVVPSTATAGTLSVTTGGTTVGSIYFSRANYTLGMGHLRSRYEQAENNRDGASLITPRNIFGTAVIGNYVYVLGGNRLGGCDSTVERATINADGTLSPFSAVSGVSLNAGRCGVSVAVLGGYLYAIGGNNSSGNLSSIERATINADSTISNFSTLSGVSLVTARSDHRNVAIGNTLYVLGGGTTNIETATINSDGTISTFSTLSGNSLTTTRNDANVLVTNGYVYAIGGNNLTSVERASINGDGTIGTFATVSGITQAVSRYKRPAPESAIRFT